VDVVTYKAEISSARPHDRSAGLSHYHSRRIETHTSSVALAIVYKINKHHQVALRRTLHREELTLKQK